ncbi:MAG: GNAT family N-acetyltransferase [Bdellovibrionota bacterium]
MIRLETLTPQNFDLIHQVFPGNNGKYWVNFNWYWAELSQRNPLIKSKLIYVDEIEKPIGYVAFGQHFQDRQLKKPVSGEFELYHMIIDSVFQDCGLGRASTVLVLAEMAKDQKCQKLLVACNPENKKATQLYKNLGFKEIGKNYDEDPLYALDPKEIRPFDVKLSAASKVFDNDVEAKAWSAESQKSMSEFDWTAWELGLEK